MSLAADDIGKIVEGRHTQPFTVLGQHADGDGDGDGSVIRSFQPTASTVTVVAANDIRLPLNKINEQGLFELQLDAPLPAYRLELEHDGSTWEITDPYTLPSAIGDVDRHLFNEGTHLELYRVLGSRITELNGISGVHFAVWAPNAKRVSVVGNFNNWDGRHHVMRVHPGSGVWDIFLPDVSQGALYKYEILDANEQLLPLKHDPYANYFEQPPGNAAIVFESHFSWDDEAYLERVRRLDMRSEAISIYEVHAGSWRHNLHGASLSYRELADTLLPYLLEHGFTHVELMPITEHPFDGSWGYQPIGLFAPTSRFGSPDDFRHFVNACHGAGVGVIMDWVPAHFPGDEHGLGQFDGTHLYEHADPKQGLHRDWDTLIYNYGRREVCNYLLSNAIYWIREFHLDGLRVDAVASMLYLDYSRDEGQWIPNEFGGRENLEAIQFLKRMNELVHAEGGMTMAEESTSFPGVSHPTYADGLGFTFKWNMGWMHDILEYFARDPAHRKYHQNNLTFGMIYAFSENFLLPLSHDEVVYGKGSMINKMPGDDWHKFANLRALYGMMFSYPGKKLNFMGSEIAQYAEWQHEGSIHWHLLDEIKHAGILRVVSDLNRLYRNHPALHETDCDNNGFEWIDCDDAEQSVVAWYRYSSDRQRSCITVCNFTPVTRHNYVIGVNHSGEYQELLNTDADVYGGSGQGNAGRLSASDIASHGRPCSISLTLPPLATLVLGHSPTKH